MRLCLTPCHVLYGDMADRCPFCPSTIYHDSYVGLAFRRWLYCLPQPMATLTKAYKDMCMSEPLALAQQLTAWAEKQQIIAGNELMFIAGINQMPELKLDAREEARIWLTRHTRSF